MRGKSEICMLTVEHSEQSMFGTVCDDTDGVLMAVMAVMAGIESAKHHCDRVTYSDCPRSGPGQVRSYFCRT